MLRVVKWFDCSTKFGLFLPVQRRDYEDKLIRAFAGPKLTDSKIASNNVDKLFTRIRMQMQYLVKCLLGRRWKDILDTLVSSDPPLDKEGKSADGSSPDDSDHKFSELNLSLMFVSKRFDLEVFFISFTVDMAIRVGEK